MSFYVLRTFLDEGFNLALIIDLALGILGLVLTQEEIKKYKKYIISAALIFLLLLTWNHVSLRPHQAVSDDSESVENVLAAAEPDRVEYGEEPQTVGTPISDDAGSSSVPDNEWIRYDGKVVNSGEYYDDTGNNYFILSNPVSNCTGIIFEYRVTECTKGSFDGERQVRVYNNEKDEWVYVKTFDYSGKQINDIEEVTCTWDEPFTVRGLATYRTNPDDSQFDYAYKLQEVRIK